MSDANTPTTPSEAPPVEGGALLTDTPPVDAGTPPVEGAALLTDAPPVEGEAPPAEAEAPEGAPEEYEDFTAPEGVTLDSEAVGELKSLAKELNLPQGAAQKVADLGAQMVGKWASALNEAIATPEGRAQLLGHVRAEWTESSKAEFDAPTFAKAKATLDTLGTPALDKFLREEGVGNHPEIIRLLSRVGELVGEDRFVAGGKAPAAEKPLADRLYATAN